MATCNLCNSNAVRNYATFENYALMKCKTCGLLFTDQNSIKKTEELYEKDYFEGVHTNFFADCKEGYESRIDTSEKLKNFQRVLKKIKEIKPRGKFLDIGCATGVFPHMAKKEGYEVLGVDVSKFACEYAKEKFGIDVKCGKLEDVKLKSKQFDIITMWDLIEHVPDPKLFLKEVRRILKDNGILFILTINDASLMGYLAEAIYYGSGKQIKRFTKLIHPIHHNYHFKEQHLRKYLNDTGFSLAWKEKSEMPIENIEGSETLKISAKLLYIISNALNIQHEIRVIAKKNE